MYTYTYTDATKEGIERDLEEGYAHLCTCNHRASCSLARPRSLCLPPLRGWWNTVEIVLFEISNSMKPYPSVLRSYTSKLWPATRSFEPEKSR